MHIKQVDAARALWTEPSRSLLRYMANRTGGTESS